MSVVDRFFSTERISKSHGRLGNSESRRSKSIRGRNCEKAAAVISSRRRERPRSALPEGMDLKSILGLGTRITIHLGGPFKEAHKFLTLSQQESPELKESDLVHLYAAIRFNTPAQIWAAPRGEMMAASCVPQEAQDVAHRSVSSQSISSS